MKNIETLKLIAILIGSIGFLTGLVLVCIGLSTPGNGTIDFEIFSMKVHLTTGSVGLIVMGLSIILILGVIWKPVKWKRTDKGGEIIDEKKEAIT